MSVEGKDATYVKCDGHLTYPQPAALPNPHPAVLPHPQPAAPPDPQPASKVRAQSGRSILVHPWPYIYKALEDIRS